MHFQYLGYGYWHKLISSNAGGYYLAAVAQLSLPFLPAIFLPRCTVRLTGAWFLATFCVVRLFGITMASSPSKDSRGEFDVPTRSTDRQDDLALARLGKKAVLKVGFLLLEPVEMLTDRRDDSAFCPSWASVAQS